MSWVVIDNNEAKRIPVPSRLCANFEGITISPFVLAELFKHPPNRKYIKNLAQYPVRLGMTPGEVMYQVALLRRSRIVAFRPFHNQASEQVQKMLLDPPEQKMQEHVAETTTHIYRGSGVFKSVKQEIHDALRSQGQEPRDFKFAGFADALQKLATGPGNVLEGWLMKDVSEGGTRSVRTSPRALYMGAMQNPYLRHYYHTYLWYRLGFQEVWAEEYKDWNIPIKKNDWSDITLSLYAAPGDIILSADGTVRKAVSAVNPDRAVITALATELLEALAESEADPPSPEMASGDRRPSSLEMASPAGAAR